MLSIVIPTYKKTPMVVKNLQTNLKYLDNCQTIVVNDYPRESIKENLRNFDIKLIENNKNLGFGGAVDIGIKNSKYKYIVLLNSDVLLLNDGFKKAIEYFSQDKDLFAVSFAQKEKNGKVVGKNIIFWKQGFLQHSKSINLKFGINGWAEGGACIIDKEKYLQLGGFDRIYSPFYWEDIDLSYRAWKKGFKIIFDPKILVEHYHESTIGSYFSRDKINTISYRNQFMFLWKNIIDLKLIINHLLMLAPNLLFHLLEKDWPFCKGLFQAILKTPEILQKRSWQKKLFTKMDKDILLMFDE